MRVLNFGFFVALTICDFFGIDLVPSD